MKQGKGSLKEFAQEVERRENAKADFLAAVPLMDVRTNGHTELALPVPGLGPQTMNNIAHRQLGEYLGVPAVFYDALRGNTEGLRDPFNPDKPLFDAVIQGLLRAPERATDKRLIRTLFGEARAVLSDRFRVGLDNYEIMARMLPALQEIRGIGWEQSSMELTDSRMYMKIVDASTPLIVPGKHEWIDDVMHKGVIISNSEVGMGSFAVQPILFRVRCRNGAILTEYSKRKYHSGRGNTGGDGGLEAFQFFADDTLKARNNATILEMRDMVRTAMSDDFFSKVMGQVADAAEVKIKAADVEPVVQNVTTRFRLTEAERSGMLGHMIEGGEMSLWGLINSITREAQDVESYDRSTELEALGGSLLSLPKAELHELLSVDKRN